MDSETGGDSQVKPVDVSSEKMNGTKENDLKEDDPNKKIGNEDKPEKEVSEKCTEAAKAEVDDAVKTDDKSKAVTGAAKTSEEKSEGNVEEDKQQQSDVGVTSQNHAKEPDEKVKVASVDSQEPAESNITKKVQADSDAAVLSEGGTEESKKGELDKSVIVEGKRKRHAVERMVINIDTPSRKPKIAAPGLGIALGDIPYVKETLEKTKCVMLKGMFRLCYGRVGNRASMKKELRTFTGFPFDDSDTQFQKRKAIAQKLSVAELKKIALILGIERAPHKNDLISNILMFLLKPTDLGKSPESLVKRKKGSKKRKRQTKKEAKKGKKVEPKAKRQKKSEEVESSDGGGDSSDEEDNNDDSGGETENAHEKASVTKKSTAHNTGGAHKKTLSKGTDKHKKKETEHESKWGNGGPTDVELNAEIDMLLHTMDLSQATMKEMCVEIACKFPNLNMDKYKSALKQRIKTALDKLDA